MMLKFHRYIKVLISIALGILLPFWLIEYPSMIIIFKEYISPLGALFLNSLKLIALPLVFTSLLSGIAGMKDSASLSRRGAVTIFLYTITTFFAVSLGVVISNIFSSCFDISDEVRNGILSNFTKNNLVSVIPNVQKKNFLASLIPDNFFFAFSNNSNLMQIVLISAIFGLALLRVNEKHKNLIILASSSINSLLVEVVKFIMSLAPIGVFALVSSLCLEMLTSSDKKIIGEVFELIFKYFLTTVFGLLIMTYVIYSILLKIFTRRNIFDFFKGISPCQLVAFTTSSSSATLPVLMRNVEENLKVSKEVSSFVLPLGCSINMDGSALYIGISVMFIAQILGFKLSVLDQLVVITNITVASIGIGGFPGGSIIATAAILESLGIAPAALSLILIPERVLDMCRTVVNISGDATVAVIVNDLDEKKQNSQN